MDFQDDAPSNDLEYYVLGMGKSILARSAPSILALANTRSSRKMEHTNQSFALKAN